MIINTNPKNSALNRNKIPEALQNANIKNNKVRVVAELFSIDGKKKYKCSFEGPVSDAKGIATKVGKNLKHP